MGDDNANSFLGHDGNDTIKTLGGDDYVRGGKGADDLDGGDGARDRISYWLSKAGVTVDFTNNANNAGGEATGDILAGFEDISGSKHDDHLTTDDNDNRIAGHDGDDTIRAGGGDDFIRGGAGADNIDGGDGHSESDRFELGSAAGQVIIGDFQSDVDVIILDLDDGTTIAQLQAAGTDLPGGVRFDLSSLGGGELTIDVLTIAQVIDDIQLI
ncbi:hypothetical protein O4H61_14860 [Roseovarius aestuarii]|nr:hypothetical protein [Roseovarius aestuarii]